MPRRLPACGSGAAASGAQRRGDPRAPGVQVASSHEAVAAVVAGADKHDDRNAGQVPEAMPDAAGRFQPSPLHEGVRRHVRSLRPGLYLPHLRRRHDLHWAVIISACFAH